MMYAVYAVRTFAGRFKLIVSVVTVDIAIANKQVTDAFWEIATTADLALVTMVVYTIHRRVSRKQASFIF